MAKLVKLKYTNKVGERKTYSYLLAIPKSIVEESNINEDDELSVYTEYGMIVVNKKYHITCAECGFEWDSGKDYNINTICPTCHSSNIKSNTNGG